jgi:hypothetical protein
LSAHGESTLRKSQHVARGATTHDHPHSSIASSTTLTTATTTTTSTSTTNNAIANNNAKFIDKSDAARIKVLEREIDSETYRC